MEKNKNKELKKIDIVKFLSSLPILHGIYDYTSGASDSRGGDIDWIQGVSVNGGERSPLNNAFIGDTPRDQDPYYVKPLEIGGGGGGGGRGDESGTGDAQVDAVLQQYNAQRAQQAAKGGEIKNRITGRAGEIDSLLGDIIGSIESVIKDRKKSRQGKYDSDSSELINTLNAAIPEIQKAFASLGLSSSTFVGDRVDGTNKEYEKNQEAVDTQFDSDLSSYGTWEADEKSKAETSAKNLRSNVDYVKGINPDADNVYNLQSEERNFNTALNNFAGEKGKYTTDSDALAKMNSIGSDYDFSKIMGALTSTAGSAANTGNSGAAGKIADRIKGLGDKEKKKLSEVEVNNPVGAASF